MLFEAVTERLNRDDEIEVGVRALNAESKIGRSRRLLAGGLLRSSAWEC